MGSFLQVVEGLRLLVAPFFAVAEDPPCKSAGTQHLFDETGGVNLNTLARSRVI